MRIVKRTLRVMWKTTQITLMVVGALTLVVCLIVGLFLWNLTRPTAIEGDMHKVEVSDQYAENFDDKWEDFTEGSAGTKTVTLTEEELSSKLTQVAIDNKDELPIPMDVDKVSVNLEPGSVKVKAAIVASAFGVTFHMAAKGEIEVRNEGGKKVLYYVIEEMDFGHAPSQVKQMIEDQIEKSDSIDIPEGCDLHGIELIPTDDGGYDLKISATMS